MRRVFQAGLWAIVAACALLPGPALAGASGSEPPALPRPSLDDRLRLIKAHPRPPRLEPAPIPLTGQDDFDVTSYEISISIDTSAKRVDGYVAVAFKPAPGVPSVSELVLDMDGALSVTGAITRRGSTTPLTGTHSGGALRIPLDPPVAAGQTATVTVRYGGQPRQDDGVGLQFSTYVAAGVLTPCVYTLSEPRRARTWWPCKDRPDDKATLLMRIETRDNLVVVANGTRFLVVPSTRDGRIITTWRETRPIATYLVALAAADYGSCSETYQSVISPSASFPVTTWAFPDKLAEACSDMSVTLEQMPFFEQAFGVYPFATEKYGHVLVQPRTGNDPYVAMENQTMSTFGTLWLRVDPSLVLAHELAHHWFGNSAGPADFDSLWLNEGFATYAEALWYEETARRAGRPALDDLAGYMRDLDPLTTLGEFQGTVHDPIDADDDGWPDGVGEGPVLTVYWKGAWVLHMLRWVLSQPAGDGSADGLLAVLQAHAREHAFGATDTAGFVALANEIAARQLGATGGLDRFFDQWLHREGRPCYRVGFSSAPGEDAAWLNFIEVEQGDLVRDASTGGLTCEGVTSAPYAMPVEMTLRHADGSVTRQVVQDGGARERYVVTSASPLQSVGWDEQGWILKHVQSVSIDADGDGWPDDVDGCPLVPNPLQEDANSNGLQDACEPGLDPDGDGIPNEADCAPADAGAWTAVDDESVDLRVNRTGGAVALTFTLPQAVGGERPYVADVVEGQLERLRASGSTRDAACLEQGTASLQVLRDPAPAGNRYYLVHPWNGCGPVSPDGLPLSECR